jgi:hypothetical protein
MSDISSILDEISKLTSFISQTTNPEMIKYFTDRIKELTAKAQDKSKDKPQKVSHLSKHPPKETAQGVDVKRQSDEVEAKIEEAADEPQEPQKEVIVKSFSRHHLPVEIIENIAKSVERELTKSPGDSRSIIHLTLERLKNEAVNFFLHDPRFVKAMKSLSYVQVRFKAYFVHDKPYITDMLFSAKPQFYDSLYKRKNYLLYSPDYLSRIIDHQHKIILRQMIDFEMNGSDWIYHAPLSYQIYLVKYDRLFVNAKGFIPTPQ